MFNIIERANQMLNSVPISREEILFEYMVQYKVDKGHLPSTDDLLVFTSQFQMAFPLSMPAQLHGSKNMRIL